MPFLLFPDGDSDRCGVGTRAASCFCCECRCVCEVRDRTQTGTAVVVLRGRSGAAYSTVATGVGGRELCRTAWEARKGLDLFFFFSYTPFIRCQGLTAGALVTFPFLVILSSLASSSSLFSLISVNVAGPMRFRTRRAPHGRARQPTNQRNETERGKKRGNDVRLSSVTSIQNAFLSDGTAALGRAHARTFPPVVQVCVSPVWYVLRGRLRFCASVAREVSRPVGNGREESWLGCVGGSKRGWMHSTGALDIPRK